MPLKVFGKRRRHIPAGRMAQAIGALQDAGASFRIATIRQRKAQWAPCTLFWEPGGHLRGVCIDISDTGARIRFIGRPHLPKELRLVSAQLGLNRACRLVRSDAQEAAFQFTD